MLSLSGRMVDTLQVLSSSHPRTPTRDRSQAVAAGKPFPLAPSLLQQPAHVLLGSGYTGGNLLTARLPPPGCTLQLLNPLWTSCVQLTRHNLLQWPAKVVRQHHQA